MYISFGWQVYMLNYVSMIISFEDIYPSFPTIFVMIYASRIR